MLTEMFLEIRNTKVFTIICFLFYLSVSLKCTKYNGEHINFGLERFRLKPGCHLLVVWPSVKITWHLWTSVSSPEGEGLNKAYFTVIGRSRWDNECKSNLNNFVRHYSLHFTEWGEWFRKVTALAKCNHIVGVGDSIIIKPRCMDSHIPLNSLFPSWRSFALMVRQLISLLTSSSEA